jgi:hypothetical protein
MSFTNGQLQQLWIAQGGNPVAAPIAAAVALAESGGNPNAENHNTDGSTDRGLWQINSVHGSQSTFDVAANTKAAIVISANGTNWHPWTTYNSGAYRKFLSGGGPATGDISTLYNAAGGTGDQGGSSITLGSALKVLTDPHTYFRAAMFLLGIILLFHGIDKISGLDAVTNSIKQKAGNVAMLAAVA